MKIKKRERTYTGRLILGLFMLFLLMQMVLATETEIKVKTMPDHEVQLTTSKSNVADFIVIESFKKNSDEYGDVTFTSYSNEPQINIVVYIKKDNVKIMGPERFLNNPTGESLYFEIAPSWFEFIETPTNESNDSNQTVENLTTNETLNETESGTEEKIGQTGAAVSEDEEGSSSSKIIYYIIGIIILLIGGVVIFGIMRKSGFKFKYKKAAGGVEDAEGIIGDIDKRKKIIEDAEKKMKEVEEDIEELKDK